MVEGIIRTAIENRQQLIIEGCYLPHKQVGLLKEEYSKEIVELYICFTESYIRKHFHGQILANRLIIETRCYEEERTENDFIAANNTMRTACKYNNLSSIDVSDNYEETFQEMIEYFQKYMPDTFVNY